MLIARFDFQIDKLSESSCIAIGVLLHLFCTMLKELI